MEEQNKNIEISEITEEIKNEETAENHKEEEDFYDIWVKKHLGEKDLFDAFKYASKAIKSIGKCKLKHIAYAIKYAGYAVAFILCALVVFIIYSAFAHVFDMMTDNAGSFHYVFFDNDLWATIIISAIVTMYSFWVWDKGVKGLAYFIFLIALAEYWDYSFAETLDENTAYGGICYFLFFIIIPILLIVNQCIVSPNDEEEATETNLIVQSTDSP